MLRWLQKVTWNTDKILLGINVFENIAEPEDRLNQNLCLDANEISEFSQLHNNWANTTK